MKKSLFLMIFGLLVSTLSASAVGEVSFAQLSALVRSQIKELPELTAFTEGDFNTRMQTISTQIVPDVKERSACGGFALTKPHSLTERGVDQKTLTSIMNLKEGGDPVGFAQYWRTYANDATKLGYDEIAAAFAALHAYDTGRHLLNQPQYAGLLEINKTCMQCFVAGSFAEVSEYWSHMEQYWEKSKKQ